MKKIVFTLLGIVTILTNLIVFVTMNNRLAIEFLYGDTYQIVQIDFDRTIKNSGILMDEMLPHLQSFSNEHEINIAQYIFFGDRYINVYMTNVENDTSINLIRGEYPSDNFHLSNRRLCDDNIRQSGQFAFPISNWDIRIYDMEQVRNVGFHGALHLQGATDEITELFIEEFSIYGDIQLTDDEQLAHFIEGFVSQTVVGLDRNHSILMTSPLLMAILFSIFVLFIGVCFFIMKFRKKLLLEDLWGYPSFYGFISLPKVFVRFYSLFSLSLFGILLVIILLLDQWNFIMDYFQYFIFSTIMVWIIFMLFLFIGLLFAKKFNDIAISMKGKSFFEQLQWTSFVIKIAVSATLFFLMSSFVTNIQHLNSELYNLSFWKQAENIFLIQTSILGDGVVIEISEDGIAQISDWEAMRQREDRQRDFFQLIEKRNKAFFMESSQFLRVDLTEIAGQMGEETNWEFLYNLQQTSENEWLFLYNLQQHGDDEALDASKRYVRISKNYLKKNQVVSEFGTDVLDKLIDDSYTLNLLVPEQFRYLESDLLEIYKELFYFERVQIINMYNEMIGDPMIETTIDDLKINIIYTKKGQYYFTYRTWTGDDQSRVIDPIAIVHNNYIASGQTTSWVSSSLFFVDDTRGQALESIRPSIEEAGTIEIQSVESVYSQGNQELIRLQWLIFQQTLGVIMNVIFSFMLCMVLIWSYYSTNIYKINLKYLFGYSYWERNKEIIIMVIAANIVGGGIILYFGGIAHLIILFVILLSMGELLMINRLGYYLTKDNVNKVLKGGEL